MLNRPVLLALLLICLVFGSAQAIGSNHPLLNELSIDTTTETGQLYLVRSAKPVPASNNYQILGTRRDLSVLAGDTAAIENLRFKGCFVIELNDEPLPSSFTKRLPLDPPKAALPAIETMVDQMTWSLLEQKINWLTAFETRYSLSPRCDETADSLAVYFGDLGLDVFKQPFNYSSNEMHNVIATQTGTSAPDSVIIICGHYDSVSEDAYVLAPGADDNGSGTAVVMACAEILSQYQFKYTIKYICFAGEEQGLRGSNVYASNASNIGEKIVAVLNYDMMGYGDVGVELDLEIEANDSSLWLANIVIAAADLYTTATYELHVDNSITWGDFYSFWRYGFAAVNHEEAWDWGDPDFNPYYHSTNDVISHVDPGFMEANGRVAVASLATLAVHDQVSATPIPVAAFSLAAYPNPFNGRVRIMMEGSDHAGTVDLDLFDLRGRRVRSLSFALNNGSGQVDWNGTDSRGLPVESGVYFCHVRGDQSVSALRIAYVK